MGSLNTIKFSNLNNNAFRTLFVRIHQETASLADNRRKAAFESAWVAFEQAIDDSTKWRRSLKDYDDDCDKAWLLLMTQAKASGLHFDEKRSNAAAKVNEILDSIGNVTYLAYEKEYAQIRKALNQLAELDAEVLKDALVDDIVENLRHAYDMFMTAQQDENVLRAGYQAGAVKAARANVAEAWGNYAAFLEVQSDDDEHINDTIDKINQCIAESKSKRASKPNDDVINDAVDDDV